ncbi:unnamed protein product, partial [Laminaria digitata]
MPRTAWECFQEREACLTPMKAIGSGGPAGRMGVSPSVNEAVRIPPMVRRSVTSGVTGSAANGHYRYHHNDHDPYPTYNSHLRDSSQPHHQHQHRQHQHQHQHRHQHPQHQYQHQHPHPQKERQHHHHQHQYGNNLDRNNSCEYSHSAAAALSSSVDQFSQMGLRRVASGDKNAQTLTVNQKNTDRFSQTGLGRDSCGATKNVETFLYPREARLVGQSSERLYSRESRLVGQSSERLGASMGGLLRERRR